jgi:hypothetical protein
MNIQGVQFTVFWKLQKLIHKKENTTAGKVEPVKQNKYIIRKLPVLVFLPLLIMCSSKQNDNKSEVNH